MHRFVPRADELIAMQMAGIAPPLSQHEKSCRFGQHGQRVSMRKIDQSCRICHEMEQRSVGLPLSIIYSFYE